MGENIWDKFYANNNIPWKSAGLNAITTNYIKKYSHYPKNILEIGCGSGEDVPGFLTLKLKYHGIDMSTESIKICKQKLFKSKSEASFQAVEFKKHRTKEKFDIIYDKGVFHNLVGDEERGTFAKQVASHLNKNGIWVSVSGSADQLEKDSVHGAIFLQNYAVAAELYFEVLEVQKNNYGLLDKKNDFQAWYTVAKKR